MKCINCSKWEIGFESEDWLSFSCQSKFAYDNGDIDQDLIRSVLLKERNCKYFNELKKTDLKEYPDFM